MTAVIQQAHRFQFEQKTLFEERNYFFDTKNRRHANNFFIHGANFFMRGPLLVRERHDTCALLQTTRIEHQHGRHNSHQLNTFLSNGMREGSSDCGLFNRSSTDFFE
jgi:hypothetical protein